jgi:hypothetical protein
MTWSNINLSDQIGMVVGFLLTLSVFSYLLRDNALFRLAIHIFIGVAAAYVSAVIWYNVIWPQLLLPISSGNLSGILLAIIPLLLSILLLFKAFPRLAQAGSPALAFMVGVGAAIAIGGAIVGTIVPQVLASINSLGPQAAQPGPSDAWMNSINGGVLLIGTLSSLAYFHFSTRRKDNQPSARAGWIEEIAGIGRIFIAITLGAIFAGVYAASMAALVERLSFFVQFFKAILGG